MPFPLSASPQNPISNPLLVEADMHVRRAAERYVEYLSLSNNRQAALFAAREVLGRDLVLSRLGQTAQDRIIRDAAQDIVNIWADEE